MINPKHLAVIFISLAVLVLPSFATTAQQEIEHSVQIGLKSFVKAKNSIGSITTEQVNYITTDDFAKEVLESALPVLVVFTAPWCGPCKILDPVIESLIPEMSGEAKIFKVDADQSPEIFTNYQVTVIPKTLYFIDGKEVSRSSTIYPRDAYVKYLQGLKKNVSIEDSTLNLLEKDWFRRHFLVTEEVDYIEKTLKKFPNLLTKKFDNGQTPLSFVLNFSSNTRRELLELVLTQKPTISANDLLGLGRCEDFKKIVEDDPDAINRADPDGYTPLFTAIMGSGLLEHGECVKTILDLGAERSLPKALRNSLGEKVYFQPDGKLVEELLDLLPMKWGPKWYNDDIGVKLRMLVLEIYQIRGLKSEDLIASRP